MNAQKVLLWSRLSGFAVEFTLDGRTFQIAGNRGMEGFWERFFHENDHPTRRNVGDAEMNSVFAKVEKFLVYRQYHDDGETISQQELAKRVNSSIGQ